MSIPFSTLLSLILNSPHLPKNSTVMRASLIPLDISLYRSYMKANVASQTHVHLYLCKLNCCRKNRQKWLPVSLPLLLHPHWEIRATRAESRGPIEYPDCTIHIYFRACFPPVWELPLCSMRRSFVLV